MGIGMCPKCNRTRRATPEQWAQLSTELYQRLYTRGLRTTKRYARKVPFDERHDIVTDAIEYVLVNWRPHPLNRKIESFLGERVMSKSMRAAQALTQRKHSEPTETEILDARISDGTDLTYVAENVSANRDVELMKHGLEWLAEREPKSAIILHLRYFKDQANGSIAKSMKLKTTDVEQLAAKGQELLAAFMAEERISPET